MREELSQRIQAAAGGAADLLIRNVNVVDLFSSTVERTNVAVKSGYIAGTGAPYTEAEATYEFPDMYLIPGLIDAHMHLESSFLTPRHFAQAVIPHGTTTCVLDPHEIANVAGVKGIRWLMEQSKGLPVDFFFMTPSCVPATHLETSGAELTADDVEELLDLEQCLGLGEVMNFPGVIAGDEDLLDKIARTLRRGKRVDGHAPGLSATDLNAYLSAGVETDHECASPEEANEKLTKGMKIMIREGSLAKNLVDLAPLVKDENSHRFMFVSDDVNPEYLVVEGHMDRILRKALSYNMNPFMALRLTTLNSYEHYGLERRGGIAPGFVADLVVVKDLRDFSVEAVFKDGRLVYLEGELCGESGGEEASELRRSVNVSSPVDFGLKADGKHAKVIGLVPDQLITRKLTRRVKSRNGQVVLDPADDILKLAVVERHKGSGNVGLGLVSGLGLRDGAIASSVAHDSHNIIIAGLQDEDMQRALERIVDLQGGLVVVSDGEVLAELPLPIAGLLSDLPVRDVVARIKGLHDATKKLGSGLKDPFTALSFLGLAVIPELRLTDRGLVDVARFEFTSLWEND